MVLAARTQDGNALQFASEEEMQRHKKEVVLAAVTQEDSVLEVGLAAFTQDGRALQYASEELQGDKELVLAAVTQYGRAFQYASEELQRDKELVLAAVTQSGNMLEYASEELQGDKEVVLAAVTQSGHMLEYASGELWEDKEVVLAALAEDDNKEVYCDYLSEEMQRDPDVILAAATAADSYSFIYDFLDNCEANDSLRDDIQFITGLIDMDVATVALDFASNDVRANIQFVLTAVLIDPAALHSVHDGVALGNKEIILTSISGASSDRDIPLVAYYHFTRNNVDFVLTLLKGGF